MAGAGAKAQLAHAKIRCHSLRQYCQGTTDAAGSLAPDTLTRTTCPTPAEEGREVGREGGTCAQTSMATEVIDESPRVSRRREPGCDIAQELVPFLVDEDDSQFEPDPEA